MHAIHCGTQVIAQASPTASSLVSSYRMGAERHGPLTPAQPDQHGRPEIRLSWTVSHLDPFAYRVADYRLIRDTRLVQGEADLLGSWAARHTAKVFDGNAGNEWGSSDITGGCCDRLSHRVEVE
jgi:hypothetical protein